MTSKISFSKMLFHDIKRRIWVMAGLLIVFFVEVPIFGLMNMEWMLSNYKDDYVTEKELITDLVEWAGRYNTTLMIMVIAAAVLCAFSGFDFLFSRKKLDLYHSIPVKREKLFVIQYVSGLLMFIVPFMISQIIYMVFCVAQGAGSAVLIARLLSEAFSSFCIFLLLYHAALLAIMLTGKLVVGILAFAALVCYIPAVIMIIQSFVAQFFCTYAESYWFEVTYESYMYGESGGSNYGIPWFTLVISALLFGIVLYLYKKRPSEAAENSMTYPKMQAPVKVLMMIPIAAGCGILACGMTSLYEDAWLIGGTIFGLLVAQFVIETIYSYNIRKIAAHKIAFVISGVGAALLVVFFRFDIIGYDTYIPEQAEVKTMGIYIEDMGCESELYSDEWPREILGKMNLEDIPEAYDVVRQGIENTAYLKESGDEMEMYYMNRRQIWVYYQLNSGKTVKRVYWISLGEIDHELSVLYEVDSFKEALFPILSDDYEIANTEFSIEDPYTSKYWSLKETEVQRVIAAYKKDIEALSYSELRTVSSAASIGFGMDSKYAYYDYCPVYPTFVNTLAVIKDLGYEMKPELIAEDVVSINIYKGSEANVSFVPEEMFDEEGNFQTSDKELIEAILPWLVGEYSAVDTANEIYADVYLDDAHLDEGYSNYYSVRQELPE